MKFEIVHQMDYAYSREVLLDPTVVRLKPRDDFSQALESHSLEASPGPSGASDSTDLFGNHQTLLWFSESRSGLRLVARSRVKTLLSNPFHYLITDPSVLRLPAHYSGESRQALAPYLFRPQPDQSVEDFARDLLKESDDNTLSFLYYAAENLGREFHQVVRPQGDALSPFQTLRRREGACRDLAVLFIDLCRSLGLAARFVSGYKYDPGAADEHELHAWAEVYLPGAGWRGYDPSIGLAVTDQHVALAASPAPQDASPVSGTYRGTDALSRLDYEVAVKPLEPLPNAAVGS